MEFYASFPPKIPVQFLGYTSQSHLLEIWFNVYDDFECEIGMESLDRPGGRIAQQEPSKARLDRSGNTSELSWGMKRPSTSHEQRQPVKEESCSENEKCPPSEKMESITLFCEPAGGEYRIRIT